MHAFELHAVKLHSIPYSNGSVVLGEEVELDDPGLFLLHGVTERIASVAARLYKYYHKKEEGN